MIKLDRVDKLYRGKRTTSGQYDRYFGVIVNCCGWDIVDEVMDYTIEFPELEAIRDMEND